MPIRKKTAHNKPTMKGFLLTDETSYDSINLPEYGMPFRHLKAFQNIANAEDTVISVRNVDGLSQTLIDRACCSKPFGISIKSSTCGLACGFITKNIELSGRVDPRDPVAKERFNQQLNASNYYLEYHHYEECQLSLPQARL